MLMRWLAVFGCFGIVILSGCWEKDKTPPAIATNDPTKIAAANEQADCGCCDAGEVTPPFHVRLLEIAATYPEYGRFDGQMRWASALCIPITASAFSTPTPPVLQLSVSKDATTHGRKMYSLFAKISEEGRYFSDSKVSPVGQVVVKESWIPELLPDKGQLLQPVNRKVKVHAKDSPDNTKTIEVDDCFVPYARKDGRLYHAAKQGLLFIMYKMDPKTPDTDEGWVYGTTTADGKEVISAGRVESCMNCHRKAPHDRLFGLPKN
jgi:hypothetical protein